MTQMYSPHAEDCKCSECDQPLSPSLKEILAKALQGYDKALNNMTDRTYERYRIEQEESSSRSENI